MINSKLLLLSVSVIAILVLSTVFAAIPTIPRASAQQKVPGANWEFINSDARGTNFNPQTQITKENVNLLELKWIFPLPSASVGVLGKLGVVGNIEGSLAPPLIVDGVIYTLTNAQTIYALDAKTGKTIWTYTSVFDNASVLARLGPAGLNVLAPAGVSAHSHAIYYQDGKLWFNGFGCKIVAVEATTGKLAFEMPDLCANVPTNTGWYSPGGFGSHPPVIYKKGNVLIWSIGGTSEGTGGGRMFVAGYDLSTKALKWRTFLAPPEGAKFPAEKRAWGDWLVNNCRKIRIEGISACDIPADILRNDWGDMRFNSGISNVWGFTPVDEETGTLYLGTAQPGPDWNATYSPGPRLFGSSIIALDANTGEIKWAYQSTARDLWDMDCSWNTVLGNIGARKVLFKGCKQGRIHALDASTGEPIWVHELSSTAYSKYFCNAKCDNSRSNGVGLMPKPSQPWPLDPRNREDMNKPWQNYPSKDPLWQNPTGSGSIESDIAFDGKTIFVTNKNDPSYLLITPVEQRLQFGQRAFTPRPYTPKENTTVTALDAATGQLKWRFFLDGVPHRGGIMVSGGVAYFNGWDGNLYGLDADTGKVLLQKYLGTGLDIQPTIGATSDGKMRLLLQYGGRAVPGRARIPGALTVFGLPDKLPEPQVITKEVVKEVIKEVVKEVPKEVIKEVVKEVVRTETKTVTVETISPVSYAAIGIGVVLVVIAGVLFTRRKKA
jgi:glucose dehydrogenase